MASQETAFGRSIHPHAEGLRPIDRLRATGGVIYEGVREGTKRVGRNAIALGRTVVEAAASGLSALPQPLAGNTPAVSVYEAAEYFIKNGAVSSSPSDSPELPLGPRKKQFVAQGEMIVYDGNIASIVPLSVAEQGSPYIRD